MLQGSGLKLCGLMWLIEADRRWSRREHERTDCDTRIAANMRQYCLKRVFAGFWDGGPGRARTCDQRIMRSSGQPRRKPTTLTSDERAACSQASRILDGTWQRKVQSEALLLYFGRLPAESRCSRVARCFGGGISRVFVPIRCGRSVATEPDCARRVQWRSIIADLQGAPGTSVRSIHAVAVP